MEGYIDTDTTTMAFLGDSIYELFVRNHVIEKGVYGADLLHKMAVKYVRAESQALVVRKLIKDYNEHKCRDISEGQCAEVKDIQPYLCDEEMKIIKRARNRKSTSKSRSAGPVDYKLATSFEALIGYLWLSERKERAKDIMAYAVDTIERGMRNE